MEPKFIAMGVAFFLLLALLAPSKEEQKQQSTKELKAIYSKMDNGKQITNSEEQRIDDIINWCDECNNTRRLCKHSK